MPDDERKLYYETAFKATTDDKYRNRFMEIANYHTLLNGQYLHLYPNFFPWHRWQLVALENLLLEIDCRVTVPYWDIGLGWKNFSKLPMWNADAGGGNGTGKKMCVKTGLWRESNFHLPKTMQKGEMAE